MATLPNPQHTASGMKAGKSSLLSPLSPRLEFFISRDNGSLVPLIPADELPEQVELHGVPRSLKWEQTVGLKHIGRGGSAATPFQLNRGDAAQTASTQVESPSKSKAEVVSKNSGVTTASNKGTQSRVDGTSSGKAPENGKKVYCTFWLKTGKCSYMQQGCRFKHEHPKDEETLQKTGMLHTSDWKPQQKGQRAGLPAAGAAKEPQSGKAKSQLDFSRSQKARNWEKAEKVEGAKSSSDEVQSTPLKKSDKPTAAKGERWSRKKGDKSAGSATITKSPMPLADHVANEANTDNLLDSAFAPLIPTRPSSTSSSALQTASSPSPVSSQFTPAVTPPSEDSRHESITGRNSSEVTSSQKNAASARQSSGGGMAETRKQVGIFSWRDVVSRNIAPGLPLPSGFTAEQESFIRGFLSSRHTPDLPE